MEVTNKKQLIKIFNTTRFISNTIYLRNTLRSRKEVKIYNDLKPLAPSHSLATVNFVIGGTLEIGTRYTNKYHTALLNFADGKKPGGWPEHGCLTQEENLCRCTNLYEVLITDTCDKGYYHVNEMLDGLRAYQGLCTDTVMYVPKVTIFRDDKTYELKKPTYGDIITCPAPSCIFVDDRKALITYERRIEQIILSAIKNKADCLVLGAWGCGAFRQNPVLIAKAFVKNLNKYSGYFKKVVFAIKGTPGWNTPNTSYRIFLDVFKSEYSGVIAEGE